MYFQTMSTPIATHTDVIISLNGSLVWPLFLQRPTTTGRPQMQITVQSENKKCTGKEMWPVLKINKVHREDSISLSLSLSLLILRPSVWPGQLAYRTVELDVSSQPVIVPQNSGLTPVTPIMALLLYNEVSQRCTDFDLHQEPRPSLWILLF